MYVSIDISAFKSISSKKFQNGVACNIGKQNQINCWRCSMSAEIQQHPRRRLKYPSVNNWNEVAGIPGVPHY
jgi:hypothetical protein